MVECWSDFYHIKIAFRLCWRKLGPTHCDKRTRAFLLMWQSRKESFLQTVPPCRNMQWHECSKPTLLSRQRQPEIVLGFLGFPQNSHNLNSPKRCPHTVSRKERSKARARYYTHTLSLSLSLSQRQEAVPKMTHMKHFQAVPTPALSTWVCNAPLSRAHRYTRTVWNVTLTSPF